MALSPFLESCKFNLLRMVNEIHLMNSFMFLSLFITLIMLRLRNRTQHLSKHLKMLRMNEFSSLRNNMMLIHEIR